MTSRKLYFYDPKSHPFPGRPVSPASCVIAIHSSQGVRQCLRQRVHENLCETHHRVFYAKQSEQIK